MKGSRCKKVSGTGKIAIQGNPFASHRPRGNADGANPKVRRRARAAAARAQLCSSDGLAARGREPTKESCKAVSGELAEDGRNKETEVEK